MTTPAKEGKINPVILAAAKTAGVDRIFKVGGAQAIAALAYGTESIPRVDKIVGPGNAFVAEAKKQVQDQQVLLDAEAAKAAEALAKETEQNKAALRAGAEGRLDQAASLIVERIVNG